MYAQYSQVHVFVKLCFLALLHFPHSYRRMTRLVTSRACQSTPHRNQTLAFRGRISFSFSGHLYFSITRH
jgi:hypothetical protein